FALGRMGPGAKAAVGPLLGALKDTTDSRVREAAVWALAHISPEAKVVVTPLSAALLDEDSDVRTWAAVTLGRLGPEAKVAVVPLIDALRDRAKEGRAPAAQAVGRLYADAEGAPPAPNGAWWGRGADRRPAGRLFRQWTGIGPPSPRQRVPSPREFIEETRRDDRKAAADALERIDPSIAKTLGVR